MTILAVVNEKGGCGKTTLVANLSAALPAELLLDTDPQGSLTDWRALNPDDPPPVVTCRATEIRKLAAPRGWTIVDVPPQVERPAMEAIAAADHVLVPVRPSGFDLWSSDHVVELIEAAGKPGAFVITQANARARLTADLRLALADYPLRTMATVIGFRQAYAQAAGEGRTVFDRATWRSAAAEIAALATEIKRWR